MTVGYALYTYTTPYMEMTIVNMFKVSVWVSSIIMNIIMFRQLYNYECWLCALYMYNSYYGTDHRKHVQSVSVGVSSIIMIRQLHNYDCWLCALYMYNSLYGTDHRNWVGFPRHGHIIISREFRKLLFLHATCMVWLLLINVIELMCHCLRYQFICTCMLH